MSQTLYRHFSLRLMDTRQGTQGGVAITASGGSALVVQTGTSLLATLLQKSGSVYTALPQPLTFSNGKLDFYVQSAATGEDLVDLYAVAPGGQAIELYEWEGNVLSELGFDAGRREHVLHVPWAIANMVAPQTEYKSGLQLPAQALVSPFQALNVTVAETAGTETLSWGILSSESGGSASGFGTGVGTGSTGITALKSAATATRGSLIGGSTLDKEYVVAASSQDISYTGNASNATGQGFLHIPYRLPFPPTDVVPESVDKFD